MRVIIEVRDDAELRRVVAVLRDESVEVRLGGDGGPAGAADIGALLARTSGLWPNGDGLAYQQALRGEWERPGPDVGSVGSVR